MANDYLRIDDRLIHGQIITAWCGFLKISEIIVIDDRIASDATMQNIMLMGVPADYKASVVSVSKAKELLGTEGAKNRLFITRFPLNLLTLRGELKKCETVFIGNVAKRSDTKYNFTQGGGGMFFAGDADVELFDEMVKDGVNLIYQTVPKSSAIKWSKIKN